MPDLSHESALNFWKTFMGGSIVTIIEFIEQTEDWVNLSEADNEALEKLGELLDRISPDQPLSEQQFIDICAPLYLSQKLRIMQAMDTLSPGFASSMIKTAEKDAESDLVCQAFIKRNLLFERMRLVSRIFHNDRLQLVQRIYEN